MEATIINNMDIFSKIKGMTLIDSALELEQEGLYETACDMYLAFHLWLNKLAPKHKKVRIMIALLDAPFQMRVDYNAKTNKKN